MGKRELNEKDGETTSAIKCGALGEKSMVIQGMIEGIYLDSLIFNGFDARENWANLAGPVMGIRLLF
jgi:hypothetical protein